MPLSVTVMLLALPFLLIASGFFSGSETALFSLSRHQRLQMARSKGLVGGAVTTLLVETRGLLITLLLGNMTINVLYFVISSVLLIQLSRRETSGAALLAIASVLPLIALILLGEVLPKLLAARLSMAWSKFVALPLLMVHRLISPVRVASSLAVITPLARLIAPRTAPPSLSSQELESLLALSQNQGVIDPGEQQLLEQVLDLNQLRVRDLMTPRVDIKAFDIVDDPSALTTLIRETRLRHIPVYRGTLDDVQGLIYARQALLDPPRTRTAVQQLVKQVRFVPEQQRVDRLLLEMRKSGSTFAIVVDEYGGTAGLVTIEDVVEHMVGHIPGPFKKNAQPQVQPIGRQRWQVSADLSVHEWADVFGTGPAAGVAAGPAVVSTLGGLVMARLGRVPRVGDRITMGNLSITVEQMNGRRIETLTIELFDRDKPWRPDHDQ